MEDPQTNYQYGSFANSTTPEGTLKSVSDLGDILEDEELVVESSHHTPRNNSHYASDDDASDGSSFFDEDEDDEAHLSQLTSQSFHLGASTKMSARNIMVHERPTSSFMEHGDEYELVPTKLKNNVRMVEDVNLIDDKGRLYLAKYSFFNNGHDLKFALTVQPDIYEKILREVNDAFSAPCGLYFCCHGGDGAHTGVSHNDYVDIKLAWFFFVFVIGVLLAVEFWVAD